MEIRDFETVFGEAKAECANPGGSVPSQSFLFHVQAPDTSSLRFHVTDFHSSTWEAVRSVEQLEDMRDSVGVGSTWAEFLDYLLASIKSEDVKLVLGYSEPHGVTCAKLVAQKSKGMPRISISLSKLVDSAAADEAKAIVSLNLFKEFKRTQKLLGQEQERSSQLTSVISAEQEKGESTENPPRLKFQKMNSLNKASVLGGLDAMSTSGMQNSPDKPGTQDIRLRKVTKHVVPTHRRAKVRGALLHGTGDDIDN